MDTRIIRRFFRRLRLNFKIEWVACTPEEYDEIFGHRRQFQSYNPTTGISMSSSGVDATGRVVGSSYHY